MRDPERWRTPTWLKVVDWATVIVGLPLSVALTVDVAHGKRSWYEPVVFAVLGVLSLMRRLRDRTRGGREGDRAHR